MKDGKAKTAKKRTTSSSAKPKVRDVKARSVDKDFKDVDDGNDNRLIVFVAIAILIILATIIGLLVGCEKNKEPEPEKPIDEIVVPEKEDKDNGVVTKEIVRKVKSTYTAKKKTTSTTSTPTYTVTIYFDSEATTQDVKKGDTIDDEAPKGYNSCVYYTDEDLTEEFDPSTAITGEMSLFMTCQVTVYTVIYDPETPSNPETYKIEDPETTLNDPTGDNFLGWYAEDGTEVTALNSSVIDLADGERVIKLTAKYGTEIDNQDDADAEVPDENDTDQNADTDSIVDSTTADTTVAGRRALVFEEEPKELELEGQKEVEDEIVPEEEEEPEEEKVLTPPETVEEEDKKETEEPQEEQKQIEEKEPEEIPEVKEEEKKPEEPVVTEEVKPVEKVPEVKESKVQPPKIEETPEVDTEPTENE